ncbi:TRAP transporter permease, partial [Mesorhizobium sp. M7A.F.Ca.CA.004.04.2.1]
QFGYPVEVAYIVAKACMGIVLWGAAAVGFLASRMALWERLIAFAAGVLLVAAVPLTDEAGWALALAWIGWHCFRARQASAKT